MATALLPIGKKFMDTGLELFSGLDSKVVDFTPQSIAFGRKEIDLAEYEMPGLMETKA